MASFPYMPFYWGDYLRDTYHLTTLEHGAYMLLIGAYWSTGEPLPDDDRKLARLAKLSAEEWQAMRPELVVFFEVNSGLWHHERIERELRKAEERFDQSRKAAERSAQVRAERKAAREVAQPDGDNKAGAQAGAQAGVEPTKSKSKSKSTSPEPNGSGRAPARARARACEVPDWIPRSEWDAYLEMRVAKKAKPTDRAVELLIKKLDGMRAKGVDLASVLNQSTMNNWTDVFEPKPDRRGDKPRTGVHRRNFDDIDYGEIGTL